MNILLLRHLLLLVLLCPSELYPMNFPWQCPPDVRAAILTNQQTQILNAIRNMVAQSRFPPTSFVQSNPFMSGSPCHEIMLSTENGQRYFQRNRYLCNLLSLKNSKAIQLGSSVIVPVQQYPFPQNRLSINPFFSNLLKNQLQNYLLKNYFLYNYPQKPGPIIPSPIVRMHPDVNLLGVSDLQDVLIKLNMLCSSGRICNMGVDQQGDKIFIGDRSTAVNPYRFCEKWPMANGKVEQGKEDWGMEPEQSGTLVITGKSSGQVDEQIQENGEHYVDNDPENNEVTTRDEDATRVKTGNIERRLKMENSETATDADPSANPTENPDMFEDDILGANSSEDMENSSISSNETELSG